MGEEHLSFETQTLVTLAEIKAGVSELVKASGDHETRIRRLESHRNILIGIALVVSPTLGVFADRLFGG